MTTKAKQPRTGANAYQRFALSTRNKDIPPDRILEFAALEIAGESGEFANMVYKVAFQGHALEEYREKMVLELGDIMWGLANAAAELGVTLDEVMAANRTKLMARYSTGRFSVADSIARVDVAGDPYTWESGT